MCDFVDENFDDYHKNRGMKFSLFIFACYLSIQTIPWTLDILWIHKWQGMLSMNNEDIIDHDELWATKLEENKGVIITEIYFWAP